MGNVNSMIEMIARYFGRTPVLVCAAIALVILFGKSEKKERILIGLLCVLGLVFVYNDITYKLAGKVGEAHTYYRVLWIWPVVAICAYAGVLLYEKMPGIIQKAAFVLLLLIGFFTFGNYSVENWTKMPENIYQLPDGVIEVADIIRADAKGEEAVLFNDGSILTSIREYDATISLPIGNTEALSFFIDEDLFDQAGRQARDVIRNAEVDYIAIPRAKENVQKLFISAGCRVAGIGNDYVVMNTDRDWWLAFEEAQAAAGVTDDNRPNIENINIEGVTGNYQFMFLDTLYIAKEEEESYFAYWEEIAEKTGVDAVLTKCEEGIEILEYEEFFFINMDNSEDVLTKEVLSQYDKAQKAGKPMILLLSQPLNPEKEEDALLQRVLSEESTVVQVFAYSEELYTKTRLNDSITQFAGWLLWNEEGATVVTVRSK